MSMFLRERQSKNNCFSLRYIPLIPLPLTTLRTDINVHGMNFILVVKAHSEETFKKKLFDDR